MSRFEGVKPLLPVPQDGAVNMPVVLGYLRAEPVASVVLSVDDALRLAAALVSAARVAVGGRR